MSCRTRCIALEPTSTPNTLPECLVYKDGLVPGPPPLRCQSDFFLRPPSHTTSGLLSSRTSSLFLPWLLYCGFIVSDYCHRVTVAKPRSCPGQPCPVLA